MLDPPPPQGTASDQQKHGQRPFPLVPPGASGSLPDQVVAPNAPRPKAADLGRIIKSMTIGQFDSRRLISVAGRSRH
jgi:hypothetical protein